MGLARLAVEPPVDIEPDVVVEGCEHPACHAAVRTMREGGLRVAVDVLGRSGDGLVAYARSRGAHAVCCVEPGLWRVVDRAGARHENTAGRIVEEIAEW